MIIALQCIYLNNDGRHNNIHMKREFHASSGSTLGSSMEIVNNSASSQNIPSLF